MYNNKDITMQIELLNSLQEQEQTAFANHADIEQNTLYADIVRLKKSILTIIVSSYGAGTIANIINNTKYQFIDRAVCKTLVFLFHATDEQLYALPTDNAGIAQLIKSCYQDNTL